DQVAEAGLRAAIVSSSDRAWIEGHLSRVGLLDRFERIICGFEGLPSKPDPALYKAALDQMNLKADEAIALEDSPNGIAAATEAGIYTIAIPNGLTARLPLDRAQSVLASLEGVALAELYPA
ncbi:MAG: HAD-IA family hydrolase, partial [Fimbriimonas ginsengisoli]|nr:HAD-IA family hydrolase [Fimbriimonas ginsengisoli]